MFGLLFCGAALIKDHHKKHFNSKSETIFQEEATKSVEDLFRMPLFKIGLFEFFRNVQEADIVAAKNYWSLSHGTNFLIPNAPEIFEKLIDFYIILGFVPRKRHEKVVDENGNLKEGNTFLRNTIRELQDNVLTSLAEDMQKIWQKIEGQQMGLNVETIGNLAEILNK
jgi:hypothetical protein